ncbi:hypothetical protein D1BOALGB6SA_10668 [Olavius sp. associated proteobacterium Delta 1]|nr:hypothetical protein D1BOALGB6SA_10668 [Olavius sp. associated proteobacterium Delta 1]
MHIIARNSPNSFRQNKLFILDNFIFNWHFKFPWLKIILCKFYKILIIIIFGYFLLLRTIIPKF